MKLSVFWIYLNGKPYCRVTEKERADNIAKALLAKENAKQNERNEFVNVSVIVKEKEIDV